MGIDLEIYPLLTLNSPHLYNENEAPHYYRGLRSNLALFVTIIVLVGLGASWVRILNKKHATARERMGKSATVIDLSMEKNRALSAHGEAANDGLAAGGVGDAVEGILGNLLGGDAGASGTDAAAGSDPLTGLLGGIVKE